MYKILESKTELRYSEREKLKKWITFGETGEYSEIETFEKLEDAKKAFEKYRTEVTRLSDSGRTYFAVTEYMLVADAFGFLACSPMQFEVVDKETYETLKTCSTYAETEAYQQENGGGRNLYISLG